MPRDVVANAALMSRLKLDPARQLLGAQCSGTLILANLGLLNDVPTCTDLITKPWVRRPAWRCSINRSWPRAEKSPRGECRQIETA